MSSRGTKDICLDVLEAPARGRGRREEQEAGKLWTHLPFGFELQTHSLHRQLLLLQLLLRHTVHFVLCGGNVVLIQQPERGKC